MSEPISYKELENLVKELKQTKIRLEETIEQKENSFISKENLYNQIINHTHEGVIVIQAENFKFINQAALNLLDIHKDDLENRKFPEIIHPDQRGDIIKQISQIISGERIKFDTECDIISFSGKVVPSRLMCKKVTLTNNQVNVLVQFENIQEFKIKDKEVKHLRKTMEFMDQYIEEGLLILKKSSDDDQTLFGWKVEDINGAGCKLLSKEKEELIGRELGTYFEPDEDIPIPLDFDSNFGNDYEVFIKNLKKWFRFSLYPVNELQIACKIVDITELYVTKQQLNENLQRNELFTEILNIFNSEKNYFEKHREVLDKIAYHFNTKRILIYYNLPNKKSAVLKFQHSIKGVPLLPENSSIAFNLVPSWNRVLNERKMILGFKLNYLPDDIQGFLLDLKIKNAYIFSIYVEEELFGSILFENKFDNAWDTTEINYLNMISVLFSNLTSRQYIENKLLSAKEKAEEADRLKSSFLANMSHDIRIPMTAIIGFSDLLADPDLTIGEREEFIELISNSGQDLLTLVDNIIDVAKIETGQLRIQPDKYSLLHLFKELFTLHKKNSKLSNQDDLEMNYEIPEKYHNIPFETDIFRFKQVMNNLIDNAIKFTDRGNITFGISNVWPNNIEFFVQDTGMGIAEETQDIIFERFSKIDRSYTKEYNGTGLGLAISKSLVELMGGEIRIVSYPGKGSTFYFSHPLPSEANEFISNEAKPKKDKAYNWEGKTILIAEDVEQNFKFLEYIIMPTRASVVWAQDGKEALAFVKEGRSFDCVLMDIRMPRMNGIDATREISKLSDVPIIAQTAYTMGDEKDLAFQAGCVDYVSKPVHANVLLKTMDKHMIKGIELD